MKILERSLEIQFLYFSVSRVSHDRKVEREEFKVSFETSFPPIQRQNSYSYGIAAYLITGSGRIRARNHSDG